MTRPNVILLMETFIGQRTEHIHTLPASVYVCVWIALCILVSIYLFIYLDSSHQLPLY